MANNVSLSYPSSFYHQFFDRNGKPLSGGKLYTYIAGSSTSVVTYKTISGGTESANRNANPIILDMAGMAELVISTDTAYKFVLFDKNDVKIDEWDNVTAGGSEGGGSSEEIVVDGTTNEINVSSNVTQGVKHYVVSLSNTIKNAILYLLGLYENVVISLEGKADKVQSATTGDIASLDADGNITDSGYKVSDFKTKQTAVPDPSVSGTGLEFISSVSQNANGDITQSKKSVQDGTTTQKGVVQLQDSVGSTESSTDKAVTPHAVRAAINSAVSSAYHAAGSKTVAQLTNSLLVAENAGYVYNVTDSGTTTSDFVEGAGHPINAGDNVGVCDVGGGVYKFDLLSGFVDLSDYLTKMGDASNTTSTFTKESGDTSSMTSGGKLSELFKAISDFFASLKAMAFKDNVSDSDINGTIADAHIASASTWNGKAEKNGDYRSDGLQAAYATNSGYAASAGTSTDSTYATKIGSSTSHPAIGGQLVPIFVDYDGNIRECTSPSLWSVGTARFATNSSKLWIDSYNGGGNVPFYLKNDGDGYGEANPSFRIPHTASLWHEEMNNGSVAGVGVTHYTKNFLNGTPNNLSLKIITPISNDCIQLTVDAEPTGCWNGGQAWGTIKWDSQTSGNINSNVDRIDNSNLVGSAVVLSTRSLSILNVQDIQGHALFAICTGDFSHRYVVDMEISVIKPNANSTLCYVSVMSKCFEPDALH